MKFLKIEKKILSLFAGNNAIMIRNNTLRLIQIYSLNSYGVTALSKLHNYNITFVIA